MEGDLKSASTSKTRLPVRPRTVARAMALDDLPSPGLVLVTASDLGKP